MSDLIPEIPNIDNGTNEIPNINIGIGNVRPIRNINTQTPMISDIRTGSVDRIWIIEPSQSIPYQTPITTGMGTPIVDMPGCVMVNKENAKRPPNKNKMLVNDDPDQNVVLCDAGMPYFTAPNYDARELSWRTVYGEPEEGPEGVDTGEIAAAPTPETPERPKTEEPEGDPPCPGPLAPRIGDVAQNQTEKVSGFELQRDPKNPDGVKICVTLYEDIGVVEAYLPSPQIVTTTAVIASVAASSALLAKPLADLLLRVVKPAVKKVMTKVNAILGKTTYRPTQEELKTNEYRVKKGLLPIPFAKNHQKKEKARKKAEKEKKKTQK